MYNVLLVILGVGLGIPVNKHVDKLRTYALTKYINNIIMYITLASVTDFKKNKVKLRQSQIIDVSYKINLMIHSIY